MKARTGGSATLALLLLTVSMIAFGGTPGAVATQDSPVIAGQYNNAAVPTIINDTSGLSKANCSNFGGDFGSIGLTGCAGTGIKGIGSDYGVQGTTTSTSNRCGVFGRGGYHDDGTGHGTGVIGVCGSGDGTGVFGYGVNKNGVFGISVSNTSSGVYGQNDGTGYGVAGRATNGTGVLGDGVVGVNSQGSITGVRGTSLGAGDGVDGVANNSCCSAVYGLNDGTGNGVAGKADSGTGVLASSTGGIALKVDGKAQFSRSGKASVASGQSSIVVQNVSLSTKSLVLATPQKNVAGVYVQAAVPNVSAHTVTISLNKTVGASYPVAWMVVERP
jgi:hypothetical protein